MTPLAPSRGRCLAAATMASLAFGATGAVTAADAGTHYTPAKCKREITKLVKTYGGAKLTAGPHVTAKQAAANRKKLDALVTALGKKHGCALAGQ